VSTTTDSVPRRRRGLRPVLARAARDLAYLVIGLVTSVLALGIWIAGVSVTLSLAVFIVGIPAVLATATVFRWTAELDRRNAALAFGAPLRGQYRTQRGLRLLQRVSATLGDPQTWRDLTWLVVHSGLGLGFGIVAVVGVAQVLAQLTLPLWYWALPADAEVWGFADIDHLWAALIAAALAPVVGALVVALLRAMTIVESHLAEGLLGPGPGGHASTTAGPPRDLGRGLGRHALAAGGVVAVCVIVWRATGAGDAWPLWVALGLGLTVVAHDAAARASRAGHDPLPRLTAAGEVALALVGICLATWALSGGGYFWPLWAMLGLGAVVGLVAVVLYRDRLPWTRERVLAERVDELTRTRRGALDVQDAELRRIERDLHDGAQARLVSLTMLIGRAEEQLADQPAAAALVRRAREEASAAIAELRDLARGIAPPVLVDRGLVAAIQSLALRVPIPVAIEGPERLGRPPAVVETAAYFVVAESITNAAKHAAGAGVVVTVGERDRILTVEIADDGPGGADPTGSGLTGLRRRVEALDGRLQVGCGPDGRGTVIRAELPCGS
jgi:signal transduction histidine kinase